MLSWPPGEDACCSALQGPVNRDRYCWRWSFMDCNTTKFSIIRNRCKEKKKQTNNLIFYDWYCEKIYITHLYRGWEWYLQWLFTLIKILSFLSLWIFFISRWIFICIRGTLCLLPLLSKFKQFEVWLSNFIRWKYVIIIFFPTSIILKERK